MYSTDDLEKENIKRDRRDKLKVFGFNWKGKFIDVVVPLVFVLPVLVGFYSGFIMASKFNSQNHNDQLVPVITTNLVQTEIVTTNWVRGVK